MTTLHPEQLEQAQAVAAFADCARRYCHWARYPGTGPVDEAQTALAFLSELHFRAQALPQQEWQGNPEDSDRDEWHAVLRRFSSLPFQYYETSMIPTKLEWTGEVGDLLDDLADIWRDLQAGLSLFDRGQAGAALHYWRSMYWMHWGSHASAALHALHAWLAYRDRGDE